MRFYPLNPILSVNFLCLSSKNRSSFRYFPVFPHRIRGFRFYVVRQSAQFVLFYLVFIFYLYILHNLSIGRTLVYSAKNAYLCRKLHRKAHFRPEKCPEMGVFRPSEIDTFCRKMSKVPFNVHLSPDGGAARAGGRASVRKARPASQVARAGFWGCGVYTSTSRALTFILSA